MERPLPYRTHDAHGHRVESPPSPPVLAWYKHVGGGEWISEPIVNQKKGSSGVVSVGWASITSDRRTKEPTREAGGEIWIWICMDRRGRWKREAQISMFHAHRCH